MRFSVRYSPKRCARIVCCFCSAASITSAEASFWSTSIWPSGLPMVQVLVAGAGTKARITLPSCSGWNRNRPQSACTQPTVSPWNTLPFTSVTEKGWRSEGANTCSSSSCCPIGSASRRSPTARSRLSPRMAVKTRLTDAAAFLCWNLSTPSSGRNSSSTPLALAPSLNTTTHSSEERASPPTSS